MSTVLPASAIPGPRRPSAGPALPLAAARRWYEGVLGWPTAPGTPLRLVTGVRFDVLDVPAGAGTAALRHLGPGSPVALCGGRMLLLVAAGSAEELPGLLEWLEWAPLPLDLRALGAGGLMTAPEPPVRARAGARREDAPAAVRPVAVRARTGARQAGQVPAAEEAAVRDRTEARQPPGAAREAAVWLRPPGACRRDGAALPALPGVGGATGAPDLVRVVGTVAAECHRVRLRRAGAGSGGRARARPTGLR
ncbi:SCO3374 family protein [Streptomyces sp. NPDC005435]|uniref:SCO3374 family protein n=1 Tax=Streptomyces sp. NPDC005435 TaxID=3154464 RepID=UPI003455092C